MNYIPASEIALEFGLIPIQVRKDLSATGAIEKPQIGFNTNLLAKSIQNNLGWKNVSDAFLIRAGGLGSSLLGYFGFKKQGLFIVAAFDNNPAATFTPYKAGTGTLCPLDGGYQKTTAVPDFTTLTRVRITTESLQIFLMKKAFMNY